MNGWTLAGFLLGMFVGAYLGVQSERRRTVALIRRAKVELMVAVERFAKNFPQDVTIQVVDKTGEIIAEGSTRVDRSGSLH